jgi:hypothetical protein
MNSSKDFDLASNVRKDIAELKSSVRRINSLIRARSRSTFSRFLIHHSDVISRAYNTALSMDKRPDGEDWLYRLSQAIVFMLRGITAVSFLFFPVVYFLSLNASHFGGKFVFYPLSCWMVIEMAFFFVYYHLYVRFNDQRPRLQHIAQTQEERILLVRRGFSAMSDGSPDQSEQGLTKHLRKVFRSYCTV